MSGPANVLIVGGGISGLSTAYFLAQRGIRSTIVEKANRLGGLIQTETVHGCQLEAGADSYIAAKPALTNLAQRLRIADQIIGSNDQARRVFIGYRGKLIPLPKGMAMMVPGEWEPAFKSELFSTATKLGFLAELFRLPRKRPQDVSVATFITDHFGADVLRNVAEPLLAGVYGGDSSRLSAGSVLPRFLAYERQYGSLIRGVRHERKNSIPGSLFLSFRRGMQTPIDAITSAVTPSIDLVQGEVTGIARSENRWRVRAGDAVLDSEQLVLAGPSHMAARILEVEEPELAAELNAIPYSSCIIITLVYDRVGLHHPLDGFGFLVPAPDRRTIAAATWINTKFPSRIPETLVALRAFVIDPEATSLLSATSEDAVHLVRSDFHRWMGIDAVPVHSSIHKWPKSMPQYVVGHESRIRRIRERTQSASGLFLVGNAYEGVGIPDCVRLAEQTANRISVCE